MPIKNVFAILPGFGVCALLGALAFWLSGVAGIPVMILALLIGLCLTRLNSIDILKPGNQWSSRSLLYIGVALLGLRIEFEDLAASGWGAAGLVLAVLLLTLLFGYGLARKLKLDSRCGLIMAGGVAICGVSAAAAIYSIFPRCKERDRDLAITIAAITVLSTVAMIAYPAVARLFSLTDIQAGIFLGGSIHNVSQAVGAGYALGNETGDVTVVFKLLRVAALLPVLLLISILDGKNRDRVKDDETRSLFTYIPLFLIAFTLLAIANMMSLIPAPVVETGNFAAKACLVISLVAIGVGTHLGEVLKYGGVPFLSMTLTTLFMAGIAIAGAIAFLPV